jgi:large subunit ribosomal protein L17
MRHRKSGRHFNRGANARKALLRNLCTGLLEHGRIVTTAARAKEIRRSVERLITVAKADDLASRRQVARDIPPAVTERLFNQLVPRFQERPGGYTRIIQKGARQGDGAPLVVIELVS